MAGSNISGGVQTKTCVCCERLLPLSEFHKKTSKPDGLQPWCKSCRITAEEDRRRRNGAPKKEVHYCKVKRCAAKVKGFGYCEKHLDRVKRHGHVRRQYPQLKVFDDGTAICKSCDRRLPVISFQKKSKGIVVLNTTCGTCRNKARHRFVGETEAFSRAEIFERDVWVCGLCGDDIDPKLRWPALWSASIDHVIPLALGGDDTPDNVQAAHLTCNARKQDRLIGAFDGR